MMTDKQGRLLVLGGFGHAGGNQTITSFAGANSWHDDISDGQVTCPSDMSSCQELAPANELIV